MFCDFSFHKIEALQAYSCRISIYEIIYVVFCELGCRDFPVGASAVNRIFLRFFLSVLLSIAVASVLVYVVITWRYGDPIEQNAARQVAPQIFLLEQYVDQAPSDEWLTRLNKVREVSHVKMDLIPLKDALSRLSLQQQTRLQAGKVVVDVRQRAFYRRVDMVGDKYVASEDDVIYAYDLPIDFWLNAKMEILRYFILALVLLVPIGFWSRAHWRDIQALARVTQDFGAGQLSVRAITPKRASIYPLAQQINRMAEQIERLLSAQKMLLHSVSHELRTPIARLEFGLELLRHHNGNQTSLETRIDAMQGDIQELNALVGELLTMAKLEQNHTDTPTIKDIFSTEVFFHTCVQSLQPLSAGKNFSYDIAGDCSELTANHQLLNRAIANLLKNALKYAENEIHISVKRTIDNQIELVIEDDGSGIPDNEREKIFEPFYRLDRSRDKATGGFGLGLAIVRQAVLLHQGRIQVLTSNLGGAKFVLTLPI